MHEVEWAKIHDPEGICSLLDENGTVVFEGYRISVGKVNYQISQMFKK